jgi:hypothetical protein
MAEDEELKPLFADVRAALQEENYAGAIAGAQKGESCRPKASTYPRAWRFGPRARVREGRIAGGGVM